MHVRKSLIAALGACLLTLASFVSSYAAVPAMISYQGRLTDSSGNPVADGAYLIKFQDERGLSTDRGVDSVRHTKRELPPPPNSSQPVLEG